MAHDVESETERLDNDNDLPPFCQPITASGSSFFYRKFSVNGYFTSSDWCSLINRSNVLNYEEFEWIIREKSLLIVYTFPTLTYI